MYWNEYMMSSSRAAHSMSRSLRIYLYIYLYLSMKISKVKSVTKWSILIKPDKHLI